MMDEIDRFDLAEGLNVLCHDYGLYAVKTALEVRAGFKAGPTRDSFDTIDAYGRIAYRELEPMARGTDPYDVPQWADEVIAQIVGEDR